MRLQANLVIIGAGIVGCSAAYHLSKLGWKAFGTTQIVNRQSSIVNHYV